MKRISLLCISLALCAPAALRAQDAATEERLNKLSGQIEDLIASQRAQQKNIEALAKEIESLREQINKPVGNYATQEDLKRLTDAIREIDQKRIEDSEKISSQLAKLAKTFVPPSAPKKPAPAPSTETVEKSGKEEKGYYYVIQSGDTLSAIVQAYREKNIKVSTDQILKANPGLEPGKMKVGQKIWIPAPHS